MDLNQSDASYGKEYVALNSEQERKDLALWSHARNLVI